MNKLLGKMMDYAFGEPAALRPLPAPERLALLVTTAHKGVFFGYGDGKVETGESGTTSIILSRARNCVYWPADIRGFLGLATTGPTAGSRVGPAVEWIELFDITSVSEVTTDAAEKWEQGVWD